MKKEGELYIMRYRLIPLIENAYKDTEWIKRVFNKVKRFYKEVLKINLDYMNLKFTTKVYNEDGSVNEEMSSRPDKGEGDWTKNHIIYIRPNQVNIRTQHMNTFNKEKYIAQVIAHELAHECYHNNLLSLKDKNIPLAYTKYVKSFKKGSEHYKEELYADSVGNYIAAKLYNSTSSKT